MEMITEAENKRRLLTHTTQVGLWMNRISQDEDEFWNYLITQGKFPLLSVGNAVAAQYCSPGATCLKTKDEWEAVHVKVTAPKRDVKIVIPDAEFVAESGEIKSGFGLKSMYDQTATDCPRMDEKAVDYRAVAYALLKYQMGAWEFMRTDDNTVLHGQTAYYDPYKFVIYIKNGTNYEDLMAPLLKEVVIADLQLCDNLTGKDAQLWAGAITLMICAYLRLPADRDVVMGDCTMEEVMVNLCGTSDLTIKERQKNLTAVQFPMRRIITGLNRFIAKYEDEKK